MVAGLVAEELENEMDYTCDIRNLLGWTKMDNYANFDETIFFKNFARSGGECGVLLMEELKIVPYRLRDELEAFISSFNQQQVRYDKLNNSLTFSSGMARS